jgi:hypothetical protein
VSTYFALPFPVFQPAMRIISAITNSNPAQVTTTFAHQYINGVIIRLDIPIADGMQQANQLFGPVVVTSPTTFSIAIDTTTFAPFAIPVDPLPQINTCAMAVPIGEINDSLLSATQNVLPYSAT